MVVKVGILEDLILSLQSIVCVHTKNEPFTAECPCPFLEIELRCFIIVVTKIYCFLVLKHHSSVSLIHRSQVPIIPLSFSFYVYLIMTQPCFLKPTLQLWVLNPDRTCHQSLDCTFILLLLSWHGQLFLCKRGPPLCSPVTDTIGCLFMVEVA